MRNESKKNAALNVSALMTDDSFDQCVICTEDVTTSACTLQCGHQFHAACIGSWFRARCTDTCPLCRSTGTSKIINIESRAKFLRRRSIMRGAPSELVQCVQRWRDAEKTTKDSKRELRDFLRAHRDILTEVRKKRSAYFRKRRSEREIRRMVGLFTHPQCPVPILM